MDESDGEDEEEPAAMEVQGDVLLDEFLEYDKLLPAEIDCDIKK